MSAINQRLCYLASPYTNAPGGIDKAFYRIANIGGHLAKSGLTIFCPIAHGHALAKAAGLDPKNPAVFDGLHKKMMALCDVLIVAKMDGWHESVGLREEIAFFKSAHKPIFDLDPQTLVMTRRQMSEAA